MENFEDHFFRFIRYIFGSGVDVIKLVLEEFWKI